MSPDPFAKQAARAKTSIEAKGRRVVFFKLNETPDDSDEPWKGSTLAPHASRKGAGVPVTMVFVPATGGGLGRFLSSEGTSKIAYEQVGMVAADSIPARFSPSDLREATKVRDGDQIWAIVARGELKPANKSVLFAFGLKASA